MNHFGIHHKDSKRWLVDANGVVFWTTSIAVAEAQLEHLARLAPPHLVAADWEIAEFALPDCPIDPLTGMLETCVTCTRCPSKDHCTRQRWCEDTGHPVEPVSSAKSKS